MFKVINFIFFYLNWFLILLTSGFSNWCIFLGLGFHVFMLIRYSQNKSKDLFFVALICAVGFIIEIIFNGLGAISFEEDPLTSITKMVMLWANFACLYSASCYWFKSHPILATALGAPSAMLSYYAGSRLSPFLKEISLTESILIGLSWAAILPLTIWIYQKLEIKEAGVQKCSIC